ncbi:MAG: hypothetical protein U0T83_04580 [Bacteriovoracaceae bacterium]
MASELYHKYNKLEKFALNLPENPQKKLMLFGLKNLTSEDVVLGLYEGFAKFQEKHPNFDFVSPISEKSLTFMIQKNTFQIKAFFHIKLNRFP